jgi:glycine betaine/proline transport system substrate-binding protein
MKRGEYMKLLTATAVTIFASTAAFADGGPIRIALNEWTGQNLSAKIAGSVLEEMGLEVEYVTAGAVPQYVALADGSLHFNPEIWTNNVGDIFPKAVESGDIVVVGDLGLTPREGWFYPPYMEDLCPGLPSYDALYDCAQAFATAETFPNGRLITYPADWGTRSKDLVADIEVPLQAVAGGSEGAMLAEMKAAVATEQPMLMMFWEPHWIHAEIELNLVEWDSVDAGCLTGEDQRRGNACGFEQAAVLKIVARDVAETWPEAYAMIVNFSLTNGDQNALILQVDQEGMSVDEAVAGWLAANQSTWRAWAN